MQYILEDTFTNLGRLMTKKLITERYVNLFKDDLRKHIDEVWNILQFSYRGLEGGFATASSKEDLINKTWLTKCVRKDGKIVACKLYSDKFGRKSIAGGTDGTSSGKAALFKMCDEDMSMKRAWCEVSGKMEKVLARSGAVPISNVFAAALTKKPILSYNPDGLHYVREIGGHLYEKVIFAYKGFTDDQFKEKITNIQ